MGAFLSILQPAFVELEAGEASYYSSSSSSSDCSAYHQLISASSSLLPKKSPATTNKAGAGEAPSIPATAAQMQIRKAFAACAVDNKRRRAAHALHTSNAALDCGANSNDASAQGPLTELTKQRQQHKQLALKCSHTIETQQQSKQRQQQRRTKQPQPQPQKQQHEQKNKDRNNNSRQDTNNNIGLQPQLLQKRQNNLNPKNHYSKHIRNSDANIELQADTDTGTNTNTNTDTDTMSRSKAKPPPLNSAAVVGQRKLILQQKQQQVVQHDQQQQLQQHFLAITTQQAKPSIRLQRQDNFASLESENLSDSSQMMSNTSCKAPAIDHAPNKQRHIITSNNYNKMNSSPNINQNQNRNQQQRNKNQATHRGNSTDSNQSSPSSLNRRRRRQNRNNSNQPAGDLHHDHHHHLSQQTDSKRSSQNCNQRFPINQATNIQHNLQQTRNKHQQMQNQRHARDHRSLSTSSSLTSSSSSSSNSSSPSPSCSMLQIFPQHQQASMRVAGGCQKLLGREEQPIMETAPSSSASSVISSISLGSTDDSLDSNQTSASSGTFSFCSEEQRRQQMLAVYRGIRIDWHLQKQKSPGLINFLDNSFPRPPPRPWHQFAVPTKSTLRLDKNSKRQQFAQSNGPGFDSHLEFKAVSYNVLSDRLVNQKMFPVSPEYSLEWFYRRELIMRQLLEFDADLIALQEVESEHYETYFKVELERRANYGSIFAPKSRAKTMDLNRRKRVDGCAIFFKQNKFRIIQQHVMEFSQIAMANSAGSEAMINRVMTKDNIGLACILEFITEDDDDEENSRLTKNSKSINNRTTTTDKRKATTTPMEPNRILVCNTHIHWDPEYCDVKLIQTIMLMNELESIAKAHDSSFRTTINNINSNGQEDLLPLVLLGDFNSTPNSGVINYLTDGAITSLHKDFKDYKYTKCSKALAPINYDYSRRQSSPSTSSPSASTNTKTNTTTSSSSLLSATSPPLPLYSTGMRSSSISISVTPNQAPASTQSLSSLQPSVLNYRHAFHLSSAYKEDTMPYTNYTPEFRKVIDYIFYSRNLIQLTGLLGPLDHDWVKGNQIIGLPQPHIPSDHLPLFVKFRLNDQRRQTKQNNPPTINHEINRF